MSIFFIKFLHPEFGLQCCKYTLTEPPASKMHMPSTENAFWGHNIEDLRLPRSLSVGQHRRTPGTTPSGGVQPGPPGICRQSEAAARRVAAGPVAPLPADRTTDAANGHVLHTSFTIRCRPMRDSFRKVALIP